MPATDTTPPIYLDLRTISSVYTLSCPTHGQVYLVKQYNGDWNRTYCADCIEAEDARVSKKVSLNLNGAPAPQSR